MSQPIALWGLAWRCACFLGSVWSLQCGHEGKMGCETKSKALSSNTEMHQEKCLSAVQSQYIWTSKHSRKAPTRHASMWLFSYALFCSNQVEPPYFSVSYYGCAITEVGMATAAGSCLGAQVYSLISSLKSDGKGTCFGAVAIEC